NSLAHCGYTEYIYPVYQVRSGTDERSTRTAGTAERGAQVRAAAAAGVRGADRRGVAAERRAGLHDPAAPRARWPRRVRRGRRIEDTESVSGDRGQRGRARY